MGWSGDCESLTHVKDPVVHIRVQYIIKKNLLLFFLFLFKEENEVGGWVG